MKTIKIKFLFLICLIFVLFVIAILHAAVCLPNIQNWGRYVFTEPKLDVLVGEYSYEAILRENSFITSAESHLDWLDVGSGLERINFYNMDYDDLICELSLDNSIKTRLGKDFRVFESNDFLIFSDVKRGDIEITKYNSSSKYRLISLRMGNKWSLLGNVQLSKGRYISTADNKGYILLIPKRIYKFWYKRIKKFILKNDFKSSYFFKSNKNCNINVFKEEVNAKIRMGIEYESNKEERIDKSLIIKPKQLLDSRCFPNYVNRYTKELDEEDNFNINVFFDGNSEEDEYIRMLLDINGIDVDLIENPYLGLRYKVENPEIQTIQVVLGIDFTRDGKPDTFYSQIYTTAKTSLWTIYTYPIYEKIIEEYPKQRYMHVVFIEIYPHKLWNVDCSRGSMYSFWIKDIYFFNFDGMRPKKSIFLDIPAINDNDWRYWNLKILYNNRLITDIKDSAIKIFKGTEVHIYKSIPGIDLRECPLLKFDFSIREQDEILGLSIIVSLDFNDDGIADGDLIIKEDEIMFPPVDILEMAEKLFPGRHSYNIVKFNIKFIFKELPEHTNIDINRFTLFRKNKMQAEDRDIFIGKSVFYLNDKTLMIKDCFTRENKSGLWLETETNLRKGRYVINNIFQDSLFENLGIEVEFGKDAHVKGANCKVIGFKKLNPTLCKVSISTDKKPFWLIFNEYYHPGWKAYVFQDKGNTVNIDKHLNWSTTLYTLIMGRRISETKHHFFVNNCANGWWINNFKDDELDILLVYVPQKGYEVALLVTGISMLVCLSGIWRLKKHIQ